MLANAENIVAEIQGLVLRMEKADPYEGAALATEIESLAHRLTPSRKVSDHTPAVVVPISEVSAAKTLAASMLHSAAEMAEMNLVERNKEETEMLIRAAEAVKVLIQQANEVAKSRTSAAAMIKMKEIEGSVEKRSSR